MIALATISASLFSIGVTKHIFCEGFCDAEDALFLMGDHLHWASK
jgi:hypothetical protein